MTQFYTVLAASANRLLASKGQAITLTRTGGYTYDTSTGTASGTPVVETGVGVELPQKSDARATVGRSGDDVVSTKQARFILGTTGLTEAPGPGDTLTALDETGASVVWSVLDCKVLRPAGTAVIYLCQVEG